MAKNLVIVESPAKVKTIKKFLGSNYEVDASGGHVRDLPKSTLGVDVEHGYEPKYITIRGKGDVLARLRKEVKKADKIYLATDPDREGEAISWHLMKALKLDEQKDKKVYRISFNEITKNAVNPMSKKAIAEAIGVDKSTVYREIKRNCDARSGSYSMELAQRKADRRKQQKHRKEVLTPAMRKRIIKLLKKGFSPEQIVGRSRLEGIAMVSHETIYRWIWEDKRRGGKLHKYLRRQGRRYAKRGSKNAGRGFIPGRVDIDERPEIVELKERFGDLEIDTIIGKNHKGAILTINDRATSRVWIRKLSGKEAIPVAKIAVWALRKVKNLIHTITADNGKEFAKHEEIAQKLEIKFYFCKPYHSWERGANENTNGLIRQYIPKGKDFSEVTNKQIKWIENKLNNRPRKRLGYLTPNEKFKQIINQNSVAFAS